MIEVRTFISGDFSSLKEAEEFLIKIKKLHPEITINLKDFCSSYDNISEEFITFFSQYDNPNASTIWKTISLYNRHLSKSFIELHKDKLEWDWLLAKNKFSLDFLIRNQEYTKHYKYEISHNQNISDDVVEKFLNYLELID